MLPPRAVDEYTAIDATGKAENAWSIAPLEPRDRRAVERLRHDVYATELGQHAPNPRRRLADAIDEINLTLVAKRAREVIGFVTVTPPHAGRFALDKYFAEGAFPVPRGDDLFEIRLLTVAPGHRRGRAAGRLMWAALQEVARRGGRRVVVMGRAELARFYAGVGLESTGHRIRSGRVEFEVRTATVEAIEHRVRRRFASQLDRAAGGASAGSPRRERARRELREPTEGGSAAVGRASRETSCFHGGGAWSRIGAAFERLEDRRDVVAADVLDAWFPPASEVRRTLSADPDWWLRTSPPADGAGLRETIGTVRGVPESHLVLGAGSSDLIFRHLPALLPERPRVLLLDPMYGEYAHLLETVMGLRCERFDLRESERFAWDVDRLRRVLARGYDLVVWVHPNNPTGTTLDRATLLDLIDGAPARTAFWVDEAYVDYLGPDRSLEREVSERERLIVCKSMSKVYALSGARVAYAVFPEWLAAHARLQSPPWCVSLPAQCAATLALRLESGYYVARWRETSARRAALVRRLRGIASVEVLADAANFVLLRWTHPVESLDAMFERLRASGMFVRDLRGLSPALADDCFRIAVHPESGRILDAWSDEAAR